jgi:hypothetical protein
MTDLIRRLETEQPSDELLADVLVALGWRKGAIYCDRDGSPVQYLRHPETGVEVPPLAWPQLLTSLDAVLAEMPEGGEWSRHLGANGRMTMQVDVPERPFGVFHGQGATPAMAALAAILKAKETNNER